MGPNGGSVAMDSGTGKNIHIITGRKIRMIECNAKCRYLKKLSCSGTLWQAFNLSWGPIPSYDPHTPPYPLYTCIHYTLLIPIHTGKGGRGRRANQRKGYRGNSSQSRSKTPTWLTVSPVDKLYYTPVKTTFRVWCLYSYLVHESQNTIWKNYWSFFLNSDLKCLMPPPTVVGGSWAGEAMMPYRSHCGWNTEGCSTKKLATQVKSIFAVLGQQKKPKKNMVYGTGPYA